MRTSSALRALDASRGVEPPAQRGLQGHLLRDFNRIGQRQSLAGQIGRRLLGLGFVIFRWRDKGRLGGDKLEGQQRRVRATLERGIAQQLCPRTAKTCANILKLWPALLTFTTNTALSPTNNAAELASSAAGRRAYRLMNARVRVERIHHRRLAVA